MRTNSNPQFPPRPRLPPPSALRPSPSSSSSSSPSTAASSHYSPSHQLHGELSSSHQIVIHPSHASTSSTLSTSSSPASSSSTSLVPHSRPLPPIVACDGCESNSSSILGTAVCEVVGDGALPVRARVCDGQEEEQSMCCCEEEGGARVVLVVIMSHGHADVRHPFGLFSASSLYCPVQSSIESGGDGRGGGVRS